MSTDVTTARNAIANAQHAIGLWQQNREDLVLGTFCQESQLRFTRQLGNGPALGYGQMEPATHDDCWTNFLNYRPELAAAIKAAIAPAEPVAALLETSITYDAIMTTIRYLRVKAPLPVAGDVVGYSEYWKQWYNTPEGAGTTEEFQANWAKFIGS